MALTMVRRSMSWEDLHVSVSSTQKHKAFEDTLYDVTAQIAVREKNKLELMELL